MKLEVFLGIIVIIHLIFAWKTQKMINNSVFLNPFQKKFNSIMNWIFPFIWGIIVRAMIKPSKYQVMTKSSRKRKVGKHTDNWENLTGGGLGDLTQN